MTDVRHMGIREYLGQGEYWLEVKTNTVYQISEMDPDKRDRAARSLARRSTSLITQAEAEAVQEKDLAGALRMTDMRPREWMVSTPLYRALYPASAGEISSPSDEKPGNRSADSGVQPVSVLRPSA